MKLHIGCGTIYLEGYINIDAPTPWTHLAISRPDLVEKWRTTADNYYGKVSVGPHGPMQRDTVCDLYGVMPFMQLGRDCVDEILMRQVFEHLSITEARTALRIFHQALKVGGTLTIDVPDRDETCRLLVQTGDPFYFRHLVGPRNSPYGYHMMSYTQEGLISLLSECGFVPIAYDANIHSYPAICVTFGKELTCESSSSTPTIPNF